MKRNWNIVLILVIIISYFMVIGFIIKFNTWVVVSDYVDDYSNYDVEISIDGKVLISDTINPQEYSWPGKIHPTKVLSGFHKIIVKSDKLNMIDSSNFFSLGYSHLYIEFQQDSISDRQNILIDKRFGRKIVFE